MGNRVTIEIAPHPGLDERQKEVIARDYGMTQQRLTLTVRKAVEWYVTPRFAAQPRVATATGTAIVPTGVGAIPERV
jgi:hypothetical protein